MSEDISCHRPHQVKTTVRECFALTTRYDSLSSLVKHVLFLDSEFLRETREHAHYSSQFFFCAEPCRTVHTSQSRCGFLFVKDTQWPHHIKWDLFCKRQTPISGQRDPVIPFTFSQLATSMRGRAPGAFFNFQPLSTTTHWANFRLFWPQALFVRWYQSLVAVWV